MFYTFVKALSHVSICEMYVNNSVSTPHGYLPFTMSSAQVYFDMLQNVFNEQQI